MWLILLQILCVCHAAVPLIVDTDIGGGGCNDVDDVGAICVANALADNGEAELIAMVQNSEPPQCAGVISVLNHYYGRDDVPIGAYKKGDLSDSKPLSYVPDLVDHWPSTIKNSSQVPDSVEVYRRALAGQKDGSVIISSIGLLTNLAELLRSQPDSITPLNGPDLVRQKVKLLAVMGGGYPKVGARPECNFCGCYNGATPKDHSIAAHASSYVVNNWPKEVKILFSGVEVGGNVFSGGRLSSCAPVDNPCRQAYIDYEGGPNKNRNSWDPLTTLIAVRGAAAGACSECTNCDGHNVLDPNEGTNEWVKGPPTNATYLILNDAKKAGNALDDLLCRPPKNKR